ncbi:hypothetical protein LOTGIDRAFT_176414, partial [Lottia gigantea]
MRKELDKYGIQMPAFGKIGGILANEMTVDDAALHAAIIAINEAIENENSKETYNALQNPSAMLVNINLEAADNYQTLLFQAKHTKAENARNKSMDADRVLEQDIYDEILTQAEIQGNLNKVNTSRALDDLNDALLKGDRQTILGALKSSHLGLKNINDENLDFYIEKLHQLRENKK